MVTIGRAVVNSGKDIVSWLEQTQLSLKGEVKNEKVDMCQSLAQ